MSLAWQVRAAAGSPPAPPDGWEVRRVGDLVALTSGFPFPSESFGTCGDMPLVRIRDLDTAGFETFVTGPVPASSILRNGDVVIGMDGDFNVVRWRRGTAALNQRLCLLRPRTAIDMRFVAYTLPSALRIINELTFSTTVKHLSPSDVLSERILLPPLEEQRRIADFLDAETARIDALAGAYRRMADLAAERSRAVVDAEIASRPATVPLRYIVRFREGPGIMAADFHDAGVPLIRIAGLRDGEVTLHGCNFLDPGMVARRWPRFRLRLGDRLISGSATMGEVSVVRDPEVAGAVPYTGLIILRPARRGVEMEYVEAVLRSSHFTHQIDVLKTGATMQHFGPTHLSQVRAPPLPPLDEQRTTAARVRRALRFASRTTQLVNRQVTLLDERRRALIAAAVTGRLDVSTAGG